MSNTPEEGTPESTDKAQEAAPVLALPAPIARRVLALTEAGAPIGRGFTRLLQALRDTGCEIVPLALPREAQAKIIQHAGMLRIGGDGLPIQRFGQL